MGAASQELTDRARLLIAEQRYADAVRACRRALLSHPDQVELRLLLGEALLALERFDEVRVEMIALTRKRPELAAAHRLLGEAYLRDGRSTQAIEALRKARELDPSDALTQQLLIHAADAGAPESTTIERWFADEAMPTVETQLPEWEEEVTPVPATAPMPAAPMPAVPMPAAPMPVPVGASAQPSIQVDPSLGAEESTRVGKLASSTPSKGPRVRSRQPTALGVAAVAPAVQDLAPQPTSVQRPSGLRTPPPQTIAGGHTEEVDLASVDDFLPEPDSVSLDDFPSMDAVPDDLSARTTGDHPRPEPMPVHRVPAPEPAAPPRAPPPSRLPSSRPPPSLGASPAKTPPVAPPPSRPASFAPPPPAAPTFAPAPRAPSAPPAASSVAPAAAPRAPSAPLRARSPVAVDDPTTRVPRRKRWLLPALAGGVALVLLGALSTWAVSSWLDGRAKEAIRESARLASDSGARTDLEAAIGAILEHDPDDPELAALHARLLAVLALEHDEPRADAVDALLTRFPVRPTDGRIAAAFVHLDRGQPSAALLELSGLTAEGEQIAEAFHARALATLALGRLPEAEEAARQAATLRPGAVRHASLHALTLHLAGDSAGALALLGSVPDGEASPAVRVTRARVLQDGGADPARANEDASAVVGGLAERATPHQLAWAHLVRARHALGEGDSGTARTEAQAAREHHPPVDEAFTARLVDVLLRSGAPADARTELARWPEPPIDRGLRALSIAEVALALDDLDGAERVLAEATEGPRKTLARARLAEARGQPDAARPLYESLLSVPGPEGRRARIRLGSLALATGSAARAIELLEPLRSGADELEVVPLLARAHLAEGRAAQARELVDGALARRADAPELLAARGAVHLAEGQVAEALAVLRRAVQARPDDVELQLDLGDAARRAGESDAARAAFEAVLRLAPGHGRAQLGMARLALAAGDLAGALERLEAVERSGREVLAAARLRAELHVRRGDGAAGVAAVEPLAARHDDVDVWAALGQLQAQAERDADAARSFARALRRDREHPEALLGQSLVDLRRGDLRAARRAVDTAEAQGRRRALGATFHARVLVARARLEFENGAFDAAVRLANEALAQDATNGGAHLVLANVAGERGESTVPHLQRAMAAQAPPPEALGRLAPQLSGDEACRAARRYLEVAPEGYDASSVRAVAARCR
jgi:tetratricopeptide (TPR) repeat protein